MALERYEDSGAEKDINVMESIMTAKAKWGTLLESALETFALTFEYNKKNGVPLSYSPDEVLMEEAREFRWIIQHFDKERSHNNIELHIGLYYERLHNLSLDQLRENFKHKLGITSNNERDFDDEV